ncbi:MAG: Smr/MutS family protein [Pseudomonadota bacterium]
MIERDVIAETAATPEPTIPPKLQAPPRNVSAPPLKKRATGSTIHPIERPTHRKLAKGRLPIDARLDLHNLTQDQAHQRLLSFLGEAMQRGHRHVLVITGKGMSQNSQGILKKMLPVWLATPPFTHMVSGLKHASRDHGGEGAWYIRLKKNKSPN